MKLIKIEFVFVFFSFIASCYRYDKTIYLLNEGEGLRIRELKKIDRKMYQLRKKAILCQNRYDCNKIKKEWHQYSKKTVSYLKNGLRVHPFWCRSFIKDILYQLERPLYIMESDK